MALPLQQTNLQDLALMQTKWKSQIDPVLAEPIVSGNLLSNISLKVGDNVINHGLGTKLQGYIVILKSGLAGIYDKQSSNQMANLTLVLNSDTAITVSLWVF
jgi:hypothetical protein